MEEPFPVLEEVAGVVGIEAVPGFLGVAVDDACARMSAILLHAALEEIGLVACLQAAHVLRW